MKVIIIKKIIIKINSIINAHEVRWGRIIGGGHCLLWGRSH